jgi:uncharacterized membrane protein YkvA (DUF1232 family)
VPDYLFLTWRLLRDPRVPTTSKVMLVVAVVFVFSPLDFLEWVPGVGGAGVLALLGMVIRTFVDGAPEEVLAEHRRALGIPTNSETQ